MRYWLMKSEPNEYSISDLKKDWISSWFGVRNYQARNFMRDNMKKGDHAFFYHSNTKIPGIVGLMTISSESIIDKTQFDKESEYFDPKSQEISPKWYCREVEFLEKFDTILPLLTLKNIPELSQMKILQKGNRLSITPLTSNEYITILSFFRKEK